MGNYRADDLARVEAALSDHQTLTFVRPQDVANRPHMRFDGRTLSEIGDQRWRTRRTTRSDTSCVVVKAGRERRVEAGHERRLGAHTSRASAWRPLLLSSPLRVSGGFDDGDRGVISSKSAHDQTLTIMSNPIAIFFDLGDTLVIPQSGAASPRRHVEHTGDRGVRRLSGLVPSASPLSRVASDPMSSRTSKGVSDV